MSETPAYLKGLKGEMPIQQMGWFKNYKAAFIDTGRFRPVVHIITGIMVLGYTMDFAFHLRRTPRRLAPGARTHSTVHRPRHTAAPLSACWSLCSQPLLPSFASPLLQRRVSMLTLLPPPMPQMNATPRRPRPPPTATTECKRSISLRGGEGCCHLPPCSGGGGGGGGGRDGLVREHAV